MAKAYFKCNKCGYSVQVYGRNRSDADRLAQYRKDQEAVCSDCYKKNLEEKWAIESQQAAEQAAIIGLPVLQGTEKQIVWAEMIRSTILKRINDCFAGKYDPFYWDDIHILELNPMDRNARIEKQAELDAKEITIDLYKYRIQQILKSERMLRAIESIRSNPNAHWWIDNREWKISKLLYEQYKMTSPEPAQLPPAAIIADAKGEATVRPQNPHTETVAEIHIAYQEIQILFPEKFENFNLLMRTYGYKWKQGYWGRTLISHNGNPCDRAAEIGNAILNTGFSIRIFDAELRQRAINAKFELEHTRWVLTIKKGDDAEWFALVWSRNDDCYAAARKLPRSKYVRPYVVIPSEFYEDVLDFAEINGFKLNLAAKELSAQAKANKEAALVAKPSKRTKEELKPISTQLTQLAVMEAEIAIDLLDSDHE